MQHLLGTSYSVPSRPTEAPEAEDVRGVVHDLAERKVEAMTEAQEAPRMTEPRRQRRAAKTPWWGA